MLRHYRLLAAATIAVFPFTSSAYSAQLANSEASQKGIIVVGGKSKAASHRTRNHDGGLSQKGIIVVGGKSQIGSDRMLNPQPLPPKDGGLSQKGIIIVSGKTGSDRMLNPQPLPPKDGGLSQKGIVGSKAGSDRMLNPQPLPPKDGGLSQKGIIVVGGKAGSDRMLNPQPLPPKERVPSFGQTSAMDRLTGPTVAAQSPKFGAAAPKSLNKGVELNMIQLQNQMSQRQQSIQLNSNMIRSQSESSSAITRNVR